MSEIRKGDLVMVVRSCCTSAALHVAPVMGIPAIVESIGNDSIECYFCGFCADMDIAHFTSGKNWDRSPVAWLKKIDPDALRDDVSETVPLTTQKGKRELEPLTK